MTRRASGQLPPGGRAGARARLALAVLLAALAGACGGSSAAPPVTRDAAPRAVSIYAALPLRGPAAGEGLDMVQAIRLVVDQQQGLAGKVRVLVRARDGADPRTGQPDSATCRRRALEVASDPSAVAVIGTYTSGCTATALPVLNRAGVALVSPLNTYAGLTQTVGSDQPRRFYPTGQRTFLRLVPPVPVEGAAAVQIAQVLGAKRLAVVVDGARWARAVAVQAERAGVRAGVTVLRVLRRPQRGESAAARRRADETLWRSLAAERAEAVLFAGTLEDDPAAFLRARVAVLGRDVSAVRVLATDGLFRDRLLRVAGPAADGVRVLFPAIPADHVSGRGADFVSAYTARYGAPGLYTVYAAEAATAIVDAIARSNGTRAGVLRELRRGPRDGLLGRYAFDAAGDTTLRRYAALVVDQERFRFERVVDVSLRPTG